jgi:hypothetical protein
MRDLTCLRCGLKVKTEERLAVPWDERDLVAQVKALLSEGQAVALRDKGIAELLLARLNVRLAPHGYVIRATKGRSPRRLVACINEYGQVERYELFELQRTPPRVRGNTNSKSSKEA